MYKYRVRPSGLKYDIKVENPTWIKKGERLSPDTEFKLGVRNNPDGEIKPGQRLSPKTEFQKNEEPWNAGTQGLSPSGVGHHNFKGDDVGYESLHSWVRRWKGRPLKCVTCDSTNNLEWSNISWKYKRDLDDWWSLCARCHRNYDKQARGAKKERFK